MNTPSRIYVLALLSTLLIACSKAPDKAPEPNSQLKPVRTLTITHGQQIVRSFPGVVDAAQTAELGFRVSGELKDVRVQEGTRVKKGQVLAALDKTDFELKVQSTQSEFDRVRSDFTRAEQLIKKGAISQADYDSLKAQLTGARIQLETAQQNLKYTVLKAPFDGIVARTYASNFEKISSSEKFASVHDLSSLEVGVDIPESIMIKLKRGEETREIHAVFDDLDGRKFPLTFKEASTRADTSTQTYRVTFAMPAPEDANILPGMSTLLVATEKFDENAQDDIYVPAHAVLEDSAGRFVFTVAPNEDQETGTVERRSVVVGTLNENGIQILQGLTVNDKIITAGMSKISDNMQVQCMNGEC